MTDKEKAIVMAYTKIVMLTGDKLGIFYQYIEGKMGRPIWSHELASKKVWAEIKKATEEDFKRLCQETTSDGIPKEVGRWLPYEFGDYHWRKCSVCGVADKYIETVKRDNYPPHDMVARRNYCPCCGARMEEENDVLVL